jgi:AbrB family looped-hinge helix DNA binding protein
MESELRERVKVYEDGRITIPKSIRKRLEISQGSYLQVETYKGKILISVLVK